MGPVPGSLYVGVLITATIFGIAAGTVGATVVLMGIMAVPIMTKAGYNIPMSAGSGDEEYLHAFEHTVVPAVERFRPELLIVSAGFDAAATDPIGGLELTGAGFGALATHAVTISERVAFVLEGGYDAQALPGLVGSVLAAT